MSLPSRTHPSTIIELPWRPYILLAARPRNCPVCCRRCDRRSRAGSPRASCRRHRAHRSSADNSPRGLIFSHELARGIPRRYPYTRPRSRPPISRWSCRACAPGVKLDRGRFSATKRSLDVEILRTPCNFTTIRTSPCKITTFPGCVHSLRQSVHQLNRRTPYIICYVTM